MDPDRIAEAGKVFRVLLKGRMAERTAAQTRLSRGDASIDRPHLRRLLLEALRDEFPPVPRRAPTAATRSWLLNALGRVADDDREAGDYVRRHSLPAHEPNFWARYWALESLVATAVPDLGALATVALDDEEPLVSTLGAAVLASRGDTGAQERIETALDDDDHQWAALRALRVVPLESTVTKLCAFVARPTFSDTTYDAIVALGSLPSSSPAAEEGTMALIACIKFCRQNPWWDAFRSKAVTALNNLAARDAAPVLVDELSDSNPSIVHEAARALEHTLGIDVATARIVEAASRTGEEAIPQYANALRAMARKPVVEELEDLMLSGSPEQQETARALLSEVGGQIAFEKLRARADAMRQHTRVLEKTERDIRELFDSSLHEARTGYHLSTAMDAVVFLLGIGAIVFAGWLVAAERETLGGITATGGSLAVLYNLFFAKPRSRVRESVEHMMALKIVFLGYLRQLHQADQAYVRRFLDEKPLLPSDVEQYSLLITRTMEGAVAQIRSPAKPPAPAPPPSPAPEPTLPRTTVPVAEEIG